MNYEDETQWSRQDLINRLRLTEAFNESYAQVIKLTCKKVTVEEALAWGHHYQFNNEFYLHPIPGERQLN